MVPRGMRPARVPKVAMTTVGWATSLALALLAASTSACSDDSSAAASTGGNAGTGGAGGGGGSTTTGGAAGTAGNGGAAGAASCDGTPAPADDPKLAAVITALKAQLDPVKVPGGAVAVIREGKLAHVAVAGSKVAGKCDPVTADTLFRAGLLTEAVTTMATLALVESQKLSLSAPITSVVQSFKVLPGKAAASDVTLGHLLAQSGGYPAGSLDALSCSTLADSIASASVPLWCQPGAMAVWDPANFSLVGLAVESTVGKPFAAAARQIVLDPLKMGGTFDPVEAEKLDHSRGHLDSGFEQELSAVDCADTHPSTQYHASIQDLGKLAAALLSGGGGVIEPATVDAMFAQHGPSFFSEHYHGYGVAGHAPLGVVYLNGVAAGFQLEMLLLPKQKTGIVTVLNGTTGSAQAVDEVFTTQYSTVALPWPKKPYSAGIADLQAVVGKYEDDLGFKGVAKRTLEVTLAGTELQAKLVETNELAKVTPVWSRDNFELTLAGQTHDLRFWRDASDAVFAATFRWKAGPPFYLVKP